MKRIFSIIFLICFLAQIAISQINNYGLPFIFQYPAKITIGADQNWAILKDNRGILYFGNNDGVLEFDGASWRLERVRDNKVVRSLAIDKEGIIYVGCINELGILAPNNEGKKTYYSLSAYLDSTERKFGSVWKTYIIDNFVYFQANEILLRYKLPLKFKKENGKINLVTPERKSIKIWHPSTAFHFSFVVNSNFYIRLYDIGLHVLKNDSLVLMPEGEKFANLRIYAILPYDKDHLLIGTREEGFFLYNTSISKNRITRFKTDNDDLLISGQLYHAILLPDERIACATLANGVIIFDKKGKISELYNSLTGIAENAVTYLFCDTEIPGKDKKIPVSASLWLTTEKYIYRIEIFNPFRKWEKINGVEGQVLDAIRYNNLLYIATSQGVYYLYEADKSNTKFYSVDNLPPYESWSFLAYDNSPNSKGNKKTHLLVGTKEGIFEIIEKSARLICKGNVYFLTSSKSDSSIIYVGFDNGFAFLKYNKGTWSLGEKIAGIDKTVRFITEDGKKDIWVSCEFEGVYRIKTQPNFEVKHYDKSNNYPTNDIQTYIADFDKKLLFATNKGLYRFNEDKNTFSLENPFKVSWHNNKAISDSVGIFRFKKDYNNNYWFSLFVKQVGKAWLAKGHFVDNKFEIDSTFAGRLPYMVALCIYPEKNNNLWIGSGAGLFLYNGNVSREYYEKFRPLIRKVIVGEDSVIYHGTNFKFNPEGKLLIDTAQNEDQMPVLSYRNNRVVFQVSAPVFETDEERTLRFYLMGNDERWSKWSTKKEITYNNLAPGDYTFLVQAKNAYSIDSEIVTYRFTILPPWYRTWWAYTLYVILAGLLVYAIVYLNTRRLIRDKARLERIVEERTVEIREKNIILEQANEEIAAQRDEIEVQRDKVIEQKDEIEHQKKNILDSIQYAKRIQTAVLPSSELLQEVIPQHFILLRPKDIVSGDFYWFRQVENKVIVIAADCTGHGVPGAFMSMLGIAFLNEVVTEIHNFSASDILNHLRERVIVSLHQTGKIGEAQDGMDLALCIIDLENYSLQYAGANNPVFIIRKLNQPDEEGNIYELLEEKADKMPIGIHARVGESFSNKERKLKPGDSIYISSDGYEDQFGGDKGRKFLVKNFKNLLISIQDKPMDEQKEILDQKMIEWRGPHEQIDDILVFGIRIT